MKKNLHYIFPELPDLLPKKLLGDIVATLAPAA